MLTWTLLAGTLVTLVAAATPLAPVEKPTDFVKGKICIGTNGRMSVPSNREHHYRNLRDRYTNCTYVDGNLELTWLQDEHLDLSFLQYIREVTGYVLISHVDVRKIVLPRLQIIRGRTLFKINIQEDEFALFVTLSKMNNMEMPGLRDILQGSVGFYNNYNLCHVKNINWDEIITGRNAKYFYVYNFTSPERECPRCDKSCVGDACWGEGPENCQKFSKINCSPQCYQGRCFGPNPRECCHLFCAGGCTGPKQTDCLACRSVYDDGVCTQECPPMQLYNPITYAWETNPNGKYAYGATCVKNCPEHLLKDNGACVKSCPQNKRALNGECLPCDGPCPKTCKGVSMLHANNIDNFKDCTVIEGSLSILEHSFKGHQLFNDDYTFGPHVPPMHPDKLEVFSTLKEVTGFIKIEGYHEEFTNLSYFRNLEVIGGRELTPSYFASLYIVKTSLQFLGLTSLKKIHSGGVAILENKFLCYTDGIDWKKIKKSVEHGSLLQNNRHFNECRSDNEICHMECAEGCWGPGSYRCVACAHFKYGDKCLPNCDAMPKLYKENSRMCKPCHEECESMCSGPGPEHCKLCKHVRDGPGCAPFCPDTKYNNSGVCKHCHANCIKGCNGPENTIGPTGCKSCEKAIINGDVVEKCLQKNETCPNGYYLELVLPYEQGALKALAGKAVCRRCHPRCNKCTGYGFHVQVCQECSHYKRGEQCEDECPQDYFAEPKKHECIPCYGECRGCMGPKYTDCLACRNFKIYLDDGVPRNNSRFNCTASCPPKYPYKVFQEDNSEPYCSMEPILSASAIPVKRTIQGVVALMIILCILFVMLILLFLGYQWHKRQTKENAVKMKMVLTSVLEDSEPLHPTNVKPNLAKLTIITLKELRQGRQLGHGAFGTVYQGVWEPEGMKNKIQVAIKVLHKQEGQTSETSSQKFLEEAYIMASVDHPHLLNLLAVCMTTEMRLITQLMFCGCLLTYVKDNRDKIGSNHMLNWCTQIASGMAYLEEKRLVHRDLAARNVLVKNRNCVKITDFGLAKLLEINEDYYKADGGKMPIKWLALECIQDRIFTHKSDVWAFGVTIWEVLTYGCRPYENIDPHDLPKRLADGKRLPKPDICTLEVYMKMVNCWVPDPDERPDFRQLEDDFAKMARDPGRYLVIPGDKFMRLPTYALDEKDSVRRLTVDGETSIDSDEYLQPKCQPSCSTIMMTLPDSPVPQNQQNWDREIMKFAFDVQPRRCILKESDTSEDLSRGSSKQGSAQIGNIKLDLPLDDDDYLMPSPKRNQSVAQTPVNGYMDLIGDSKQSDDSQARVDFVKNFNAGLFMTRTCVDNPEYLMSVAESEQDQMQTLGIPRVRHFPQRSSEEESDHEYYNDFDRLKREMQPLRRNETTV